MIIRVMQLALITVSLYGCVAPQMSLKKAASSNIKSVEHVLVMAQSEINATIHKADSGNTGLIGMLVALAVNHSRQTSADEHAAPIKEELASFDFRKTMLNQIESEFRKMDYKIITKLQTVASETNKRVALEESIMDAVLFTTVTYRLESKALVITASSGMYPKSKSLFPFRDKPNEEKLLDIDNQIYRKVFTFTKQNIEASMIASSLTEGAASIAEQIVKDLRHPV